MCSSDLAIAAMHTAFPDEWAGKTITIYATTDTFGGQPVDAIRVRQLKPADNVRAYGDPERGAAPFDLDGTLSEISGCEDRSAVEAMALSLKPMVPKEHRAAVKAALDAARAKFPAEEPAA